MAASGDASVMLVHRGVRERVAFDKSRPLMTALTTYCAKYGMDVSVGFLWLAATTNRAVVFFKRFLVLLPPAGFALPLALRANCR